MSIAQETIRYITSRPAIRECLRRGVINLTALAREIGDHYGHENHPPIVAAARRYALRLKGYNSVDRKIDRALRKARVLFRSGVSIIVFDRPLERRQLAMLRELLDGASGPVNLVQGENRGIVIVPSEDSHRLARYLGAKVVQVFDDLIQLTVTQSLDVMTTHGVAARMFSLLAQAEISPVESLMIGGEHVLFVQERDLVKVMDLIRSGYIGNARNAKVRI